MTIRPGSHVQWLMTVLAMTGELPAGSMFLFGNGRTWRRLVLALTGVQEFRLAGSGERFTCRLLQVRGNGKLKTVRFYKAALPILERVDAGLYRYYMEAFYQHRMPGDAAHIERNHRVAEAVLMCMNAGIEVRPTLLPKLQDRSVRQIVPDSPSFYQGKDLKKIRPAELNKTMFSRAVGMVFYPGGGYAVYNSRDALMKWNGMGEFKTRHSLTEAGRLNAGLHDLDAAILFGNDYGVALRTVRESEQNRRLELRFDGVYPHIHFIPMSDFGIRLLRMLVVPDWDEILLELLFDAECRSYNRGHFEYDACVDGVFILSHLDGDIARLIRFRQALSGMDGTFEVLCFPEQALFLRDYLGCDVRLKTIDMGLVETELSPVRRNLFEE